jgi:Putative Zn-dependent protease, contains TPR repeats
MTRIIIYSLVFVACFLAIWLSLSRINWMGILKVENISKQTEKKLGDLLWNLIDAEGNEVKSDSIKKPIQRIVNQLCHTNQLSPKTIKLHIIESEELNAFTLPGGHIILHTALINECSNQHELAGVLAHEIAHVSLDHIMKKLYKEVGIAVIVSATSPGGSYGHDNPLTQLFETLSSSAFDRELEKDADLKAVEYMQNAQLNPEGLATFLKKLSDYTPSIIKQTTWLQTHPDSEDRHDYILAHIKENMSVVPVLNKVEWNVLKDAVKYTPITENDTSLEELSEEVEVE